MYKPMQKLCCKFHISRVTARYMGTKSSSTLGVIGAGQMAEALLRAVIARELIDPASITVHDVHEERMDYMSKKYGVKVSNSIAGVLDFDLVVLACKPQNVLDIGETITSTPKGVIMSVVAGMPVDKLQAAFKTKKIVRCMPNTPASVGEGMTVWYSSKEVPEDIEVVAKEILRCAGNDSTKPPYPYITNVIPYAVTGDEVKVADEGLIDMATAVSGTGPAYVFLTVEAMVDAAVHMGLPRSMATKLVNKTVKGSVVYAQASGHSVSTLRNNVTSPGGTTASALYELEKGGYRTVMANAMWAAYRRALELGGENSNVGPGRNRGN